MVHDHTKKNDCLLWMIPIQDVILPIDIANDFYLWQSSKCLFFFWSRWSQWIDELAYHTQSNKIPARYSRRRKNINKMNKKKVRNNFNNRLKIKVCVVTRPLIMSHWTTGVWFDIQRLSTRVAGEFLLCLFVYSCEMSHHALILCTDL